MTRTYKNLYPQIWQPANLWTAFHQAARGKRSQPAVAAFEYELETQLIGLEEELHQQSYKPGRYHNFYIQSPKRRLISAAPFRDRVVHHALMNIIEPLFERQFIFDCYANRLGKGLHRALDRCTYYLRRHRYVMLCDVRQFFPSVDHQILLDILSRTIGDPDVMGLIKKILVSGVGVQAGEYEMVYFPGDDLFAAQRPRGLPIGNLTSQHWANVYLNELDQFVKRDLGCRAYVRYVDDILLFADQKRLLQTWKQAIVQYLRRLRLTVHERCAQPRPVDTGVPFLGFIVFPEHRRLKNRAGLAYRRRLRTLVSDYRQGFIDNQELKSSLLGWINHARYADTWGLRQSILDSVGLGVEEPG